MTAQPPLFPVDQTTDARCELCAAVRPAGQQKTPDCQYDRDREGRRPALCLNAIRPEFQEIPF